MNQIRARSTEKKSQSDGTVTEVDFVPASTQARPESGRYSKTPPNTASGEKVRPERENPFFPLIRAMLQLSK